MLSLYILFHNPHLKTWMTKSDNNHLQTCYNLLASCLACSILPSFLYIVFSDLSSRYIFFFVVSLESFNFYTLESFVPLAVVYYTSVGLLYFYVYFCVSGRNWFIHFLIGCCNSAGSMREFLCSALMKHASPLARMRIFFW